MAVFRAFTSSFCGIGYLGVTTAPVGWVWAVDGIAYWFRCIGATGNIPDNLDVNRSEGKDLYNPREDIMSLSEQEQRALREIEQALMADDPKFGKSVTGENTLAGGGLTLRGIALFVVGLVLLVAGVALSQQTLWFSVLGVVGFLVMFGSGVWMLRGGGRSDKISLSPRGGGVPSGPSGGSSLGDKMEENFRRRFEGR